MRAMKQRNLSMNRRIAGFTLIELLVVISIISLLVSLLLPSLSAARDETRRTVCLAMLRSVGTANEMYAGEFPDWYIPQRHYKADGVTTINWYQNSMCRRLLGVADRTGVYDNRWPVDFVCPAAEKAISDATPEGARVADVCGMNFTGMVYRGPNNCLRGLRANEMSNPGGKLGWTDATDWQVTMIPSVPSHLVDFRHKGRLNVVFYDCHTEVKSPQQLDQGGTTQRALWDVKY